MALVDPTRLQRAYGQVRADLLDARCAAGHWEGELSSSALSTATAVSALALVQQRSDDEREYEQLIDNGVRWIMACQNQDGGWGDTDRSYSNISTTMLVIAAVHLAGQVPAHTNALRKAEAYVDQAGGISGLRRRYGRDRTFAVPILTNSALAGLVPWSEVAPLPFELAALPQRLYRFLGLPVVSYAIPALVAVGQAKWHHDRPWNPVTRCFRFLTARSTLNVLEKMQPASGGYLEAIPLTSFVVMSLAGIGRADHIVAQRGTRFLVQTVRADGSWPIDTNLATWNTTLAINALSGAGEDVTELICLDWLLSCQQTHTHPFTGAAPGGWGWSDLSGSVPDADDTPGALLALRGWKSSTCNRGSPLDPEPSRRVQAAGVAGVRWLLDLQNRDGGWPTFCRGWTKLPFDRSGSDLTAHVIRALIAWQTDLATEIGSTRIERAIHRGFDYLGATQRPDGSWVPLWFGNQDRENDENPVYGTAKVLLAYRDAEQLNDLAARRGLEWLRSAQHADGSWESVEETALAVESLLAASTDTSLQPSVAKGLDWLIRAVEEDRHQQCSPIGFYFAKLWYYESLYPITFVAGALGQAVRGLLPRSNPQPASPHLSRA